MAAKPQSPLKNELHELWVNDYLGDDTTLGKTYGLSTEPAVSSNIVGARHSKRDGSLYKIPDYLLLPMALSLIHCL